MTYVPYGTSAPACIRAGGTGRPALVMRCRQCERAYHYPRRNCPRCLSSSTVCVPVDEPLTVRSAVAVWRPQAAVFFDQVPVVMVAASLGSDGTIIAEGLGWAVSSLPRRGEFAAYVVLARRDGARVPMLVPWSDRTQSGPPTHAPGQERDPDQKQDPERNDP